LRARRGKIRSPPLGFGCASLKFPFHQSFSGYPARSLDLPLKVNRGAGEEVYDYD
jgi:hypothetical protein